MFPAFRRTVRTPPARPLGTRQPRRSQPAVRKPVRPNRHLQLPLSGRRHRRPVTRARPDAGRSRPAGRRRAQKPGANSTLATALIAQAPADGWHLGRWRPRRMSWRPAARSVRSDRRLPAGGAGRHRDRGWRRSTRAAGAHAWLDAARPSRGVKYLNPATAHDPPVGRAAEDPVPDRHDQARAAGHPGFDRGPPAGRFSCPARWPSSTSSRQAAPWR